MDFYCKDPELVAIAVEATSGDEEDCPPGLFDAGHHSDIEDEDGDEVAFKGGKLEGAVNGGGKVWNYCNYNLHGPSQGFNFLRKSLFFLMSLTKI